MKWHPDVPDLPFEKPVEIEELEQMDRRVLDSMPGVEVDEKVDDVADAVARAYKRESSESSYDECVEVVSTALTVTGSSIGGHVGTALIARSEHAAKTACQLAFPEHHGNN